MNKFNPKKLLSKIPGKAKRATALALSVTMLLSLVTLVLPTRAADATLTFKDLYTREADPNTMDSYIQASLGGYPGGTVVRNYGTRYAGEVWADLSVFALGQNGYDPSGSLVFDKDSNPGELTLDRFTDGVDGSVTMMSYSDFLNVFSVLGSSQASVDEEPIPLDVVFILDTSASMSSTGEDQRYLSDPVYHYDKDGNLTGTNYNARLEAAADALNDAFELLMNNGSKYNRVALVTFDDQYRTIMELGRYDDDFVRRESYESGGYRDGERRYFTIAQSSLAAAAETILVPRPNPYVLDAKSLEQDLSLTAENNTYPWPNGGTNVVGDYFTIHWSSNSRYQSNSQTWDDYTTDRRINFGGAATTTTNSIEFTTSGPATVKVWWVYGGNTERQVGILNSAGDVVDQTSVTFIEGSTNNSKHLDTLEISEAGTYYFGGVGGNNYIYKVEVTEYTREVYNTTNKELYEEAAVYGVLDADAANVPSYRPKSNNSGEYQFFNLYAYNNDPRFPQALRAYNSSGNDVTGNDSASISYYVIADGKGYAQDWKVVEVNAVPETDDNGNRTIYAGTVHSQAVENPQDPAYKYDYDTKAGNEPAYNYFYTHSTTNTVDGVALGMQILRENKDTAVNLYRENGILKLEDDLEDKSIAEDNEPNMVLPRHPIVVILSDGTPNPSKVPTDWWKVPTENRGTLTSGINNNGLPLVISAIAAYNKRAINRNYFSSFNDLVITSGGDNGITWDGRTVECDIYTFGFMLASDVNGSFTSDGQAARATLNPAGIFDETYKDYALYSDLSGWIKDYIDNKDVTMSSYTMKHPTPTTDDINTEEWLTYPTKYSEVDKAADLSDMFEELIRSLLNPAFVPVSGSNASGTLEEDSLTYMNPIGKYMTVDGVTDLTMFGEHYKVGRYAVYDYAANEVIRGNDEFITEGWYKEITDSAGNVTGYNTKEGDISENYWDDGWVYRVTFKTAQQLIPTLAETESNAGLTAKQKSTTYIIYRITGLYDDEAGTLEEITDTWLPNKSYGTGLNARYFDLYDDISIWVEDSRDFNAANAGADFVLDTGYDQALYVDVKANALPTQIATVTMQSTAAGRDPTQPIKYEDNLADTAASTPLRVYYSVSLDPAYLRYANDAAEEAQDKSQAVGVAMADIDAEYSKANTGYYLLNPDPNDNFYDKVDPDTEGAGRYTAFYTNYFTNSSYTGYPVTTSEFDTSRGNSVLTFNASTDNQFYRFQKNRVLFLIPGAIDDDPEHPITRPSEIELGSLSNVYVSNDYSKISDTNGDGWHRCEPTDFNDLLAVLNAKREDNNTPYLSCGPCIPVVGDNYNYNDKDTGEAKTAPQINSDNWYYIIREYYIVGTDGVELHYMAIARKGSEFGSGLPGRGEDDMGEMVQWWNPTSGETKPFSPTSPGAGYYIAAKPGGLRVGGMSNFVGTKGYEIRDTETKTEGKVETNNVTGTADTYFLPAVSSYTDGDSDAIILLYQGNNGRIIVPQTLLLVTKLVQKLNDNGDAVYDLEYDTEFEFQVTIDGFTGEHGAVKVMYDETLGRWRRTIGSISALTNADGLLIAAGRADILARVVYDGTTVEAYTGEDGQDVNDLYYVYIPDASGSTEVYHYDDDAGKPTVGIRNESPTDIEFQIETVYLIPYSGYTGGTPDTSAGVEISNFVIATMEPNDELGEDTANVTLDSYYNISAAYVTEIYEFDENNTTTVTLKSGEGRLFNTIANGTEFTVVETLDADQVEAGWTATVRASTGTQESIKNDGGSVTYTVEGDTGHDEAFVHYINQNQTSLIISKELEAADGTTLTKEDMDQKFEFTIELRDSNDASLNGLYSYDIYERSEDGDKRSEQGHLIGFGSRHKPETDHKEGEEGLNDIQADGDGTWKVELTHGQYIIISGLPEDVQYTIKETEDAIYKVDGQYEQSDSTEGKVSVTVEFVNVKKAPDPVMIDIQAEKVVTVEEEGTTFPREEFTFTLEAVSGPDGMAKEDIPMPEVNPVITGAGPIIFEGITFTKPGEYIYKIIEEKDNAPGFSYDTEPRKQEVIVTVIEEYVDGKYTGKLAVEGVKNNVLDSEITITNTFGLDTFVTLEGTKILEAEPEGSATLTAGQFTFILTADEGSPLPEGATNGSVTTTNGTNGSFSFTAIKFTQEGTYTYTITEDPYDEPGYTSDNRTYKVTVTIREGDDGYLSHEVKYEVDGVEQADLKFTNHYTEPETGGLTVSKTVTGNAGNTTKAFTFTVTLDDTSINGEYGDMTFENGVATFTLKHGESKTAEGLPAGITYTVTENPDGYDQSIEGKEQDKITNGGTAEVTFNNHKDNPPPPPPATGNLKVTKTVTGNAGDTTKAFNFTVKLSDTTINGTYGDMTFENGVAEVELRHGESVTASNLSAGTTYTVTETEANQDDYTTTATGATGTIPANGTATAAFVNDKNETEPETGSLTVTKTVTGNAGDTEQEFTFTVTLSDSEINGIYGDMSFTDGVASFTLKHGESKTAAGLPAGITYTVTETEANQDDYTTTSTGEEGTITANGTATAAFVNDKNETEPETGSLTVTKTVTGNAGDTEQEFTFTVTLDDTGINGTYGDMTFTDGVASFTLKHGESQTAAGLPAGITYTVTEAEANQDDYVTTATGDTGMIPDNGAASAVFTNTREEEIEPATGSLTVSKTVAGNSGDRYKEFHFTVTLSDTSISGTYGDMTFVNGVASFTLRSGRSKTATGLPADVAYTVTEAEANQDDYVTTATGDTGTIPDNGAAAASFTNTKDVEIEPGEGNLTVNKIVGGNAGDRTREFNFAVVLSDDTINGTYGDMTFVNGVAGFTLRHGESWTATGLPAGITYSVMEAEANQDGYTTASKNRDGTIPEQGTVQAAFYNTMGELMPDDPLLEEFDDPEIPLAGFPNFPNPPQTGDNSHPVFWMTLMIVSAIGLALTVFFFNGKRNLFSAIIKRIRK